MEIEEARKYLAIDRDDLDSCLEQQPELYHSVALSYEQAVSARDLAKLELEEAQAEIGAEMRTRASDNKERLTEGALDQYVTTHPRVQKLERALLKAKGSTGEWSALKEAFQQRSFMLREIVARGISQYHDLSIERGSFRDRNALADKVRQQASDMRREKMRK
jgi:hypothetical protein